MVKSPTYRLYIPLFLAVLALAGTGCSLVDMANSASQASSTSTSLPTAPPTEVTCQAATTADQVGQILLNAELAEHNQPSISITILYPSSTQWVDFARPDTIRFKDQVGEVWAESMMVGGQSYSRSSTQGWQATPLLDPAAAIMLQNLTKQPTPLSRADIQSKLEAQGLTDIKFEGWSSGLAADFPSACLYNLTVKSGDRIMYSQKTWIDPTTGLRAKFEARDETGAVIETRLFDYEPLNLSAPVP